MEKQSRTNGTEKSENTAPIKTSLDNLEEPQTKNLLNNQGSDENSDEDFGDLDLTDENEKNTAEMEDIEMKLEKGEDLSAFAAETAIILKTKTIYSCPLSNKIYFRNKWIKDTITDIYTVKTELAIREKYFKKKPDIFIGVIEVYDKKIEENKSQYIDFANKIESELEDRPSFEKIIKVIEKNKILYLCVNTTRLTVEISRSFRYEFGGALQYEWFERNQYVRTKWFPVLKERDSFKDKMAISKEMRIGMFPFEDYQ